MKKEFPAESSSVEEILNYSLECLQARTVNHQLLKEYRLVIEEVLIKLIEKASYHSQITVETTLHLNQISLRLACPGTPVVLGQEAPDDLGGRIIAEYRDYLNQSYASGVNYVDFCSSGGYVKIGNVAAILLSVIAALLIRFFCSQAQINVLETDLIYPVNRFFAGCMQALATPVVFLSLTALVVRLLHKFDHNAHLLLVFGNYIVSSVTAILIGFLVCKLFPIGHLLPVLSDLGSHVTSNGFLEDISSMFSFENLIDIFTIANPIPMLFVAILLGLAAGSVLGIEGQWIRNAIVALNSLFARMLSIIYDTIPFFLFFALLANWINNGLVFLQYLVVILAILVPLCLLMFAFYALQLRISGTSLPAFLKDYREILKENFRIGSNISALPYNRRVVGRKVRMSVADVNDRLSLGAMVNMDGNCLVISSCALYMIRLTGTTITPAIMLNIAIIILLLSVGAPNQPGSFLVGMVFIMSFMGISSDLYDIVIILEALTGTLYSFVNCCGDLVNLASASSWNQRKMRNRK